ncbi:phage holin family protein [Caproiciproducens galactitolivorans]|uniref:Holin family protein n=1 Tax=Caproiciproducens galactitolivorans TaxID=642589 RepID=A0A4Z0Y8N8_9FIRM|nr:phage holin family protein [Caproiciproducens galactitolivorans]QEY33745.1 phage holin family protein [Caproiciproducens galactitolivorans]QEY33884.1 phage holin family protein [Caproiciproducens galactitolivorans]QEY34603.1 phage holin family protein [Caproiciproducens galactitolivorans]TGJ75320.1 holin family protein [Caproiciproducens galactitolivorans]
MDKARALYFSVLTACSAAGAVLAKALGGWDESLQVLITFMAVDYVLGIIIALVWKSSPKTEDGSFESNASLKGLFRKGGILAIVYMAVQIDMLAGNSSYIRNTVILFFIANEGFSIIENLGIMGLPMPEVIKNAFAAIKKQSEQK